VLFRTDTGYLNIAKEWPCLCSFLPLCSNETVFKNEHLPRTELPFFVGVANEKRIEYLSAIQDKIVIYGSGWPMDKLSQHKVHNRKIPPHIVQSFISRTTAPINLTFSKNNINGLNFRTFDASASGGLIISNAVPDLELCYHIGEEAVVYKTPEDLNNLIHDIIQHPDKYQKIAEAGYQRTLKEHTYRKRMEQMFSFLKENKVIS
jgi:spore maturation protein CgeB